MKRKPPDPTAWDRMLAGVQETLARVEEEVRKQEIYDEEPAAAPEAPGWREKLLKLEDSCRRLSERVDQAERATVEIDAALAKREAALKEWLEGAQAAHARLAKAG